MLEVGSWKLEDQKSVGSFRSDSEIPTSDRPTTNIQLSTSN